MWQIVDIQDPVMVAALMTLKCEGKDWVIDKLATNNTDALIIQMESKIRTLVRNSETSFKTIVTAFNNRLKELSTSLENQSLSGEQQLEWQNRLLQLMVEELTDEQLVEVKKRLNLKP
jgi:hypothetical protein